MSTSTLIIHPGTGFCAACVVEAVPSVPSGHHRAVSRGGGGGGGGAGVPFKLIAALLSTKHDVTQAVRALDLPASPPRLRLPATSDGMDHRQRGVNAKQLSMHDLNAPLPLGRWRGAGRGIGDRAHHVLTVHGCGGKARG